MGNKNSLVTRKNLAVLKVARELVKKDNLPAFTKSVYEMFSLFGY